MKYINLYDGRENAVSNSVYEKVKNLNKTILAGGWVLAIDTGLIALPYKMSEENAVEIMKKYPLPFPRFNVTDQIDSWDQKPYGTLDLMKEVAKDPEATKILTNFDNTYGLNSFLLYETRGVANNDFILAPSTTPSHLVAKKYRPSRHLLDMTIKNTGEHFLAFIIKMGVCSYALIRIKPPVNPIIQVSMAETIMCATTKSYGNDFSVGTLRSPWSILEISTMFNRIFEGNPTDTMARNMGSAHIDGIIMDAVDEDD